MCWCFPRLRSDREVSRRLRKKRVFSRLKKKKKGQFSINQCPIEISWRCVQLEIAICVFLVSLNSNFWCLWIPIFPKLKRSLAKLLERNLPIYFPEFNFKFNFLSVKVDLGSTSNCEATEETSVADTSDLVICLVIAKIHHSYPPVSYSNYHYHLLYLYPITVAET